MASAKIATLVIRTLAKPISNQIKQQVKQHERFRTLCVDLAQYMYRTEVKLRQNILGEPAAKHIRPLSEAKAIENGANALAEGFLFSVAAALIIAETWRSSRNASKRRDSVDDQLDDLGTRLGQLSGRVDELVKQWEEERDLERESKNIRESHRKRTTQSITGWRRQTGAATANHTGTAPAPSVAWRHVAGDITRLPFNILILGLFVTLITATFVNDDKDIRYLTFTYQHTYVIDFDNVQFIALNVYSRLS